MKKHNNTSSHRGEKEQENQEREGDQEKRKGKGEKVGIMRQKRAEADIAGYYPTKHDP